MRRVAYRLTATLLRGKNTKGSLSQQQHGCNIHTSTAQAADISSQLNDPSLLQTNAFIGGEWVRAASGSTFPVHDPSTDEEIAIVTNCAAEDTDDAIDAASAAFTAWADRPAVDRAAIMHRWYHLMRDAKDDIATLMTLECGKPLAESRQEFDSGVESVAWFAEEAKRADGDVLQPPTKDKRIIIIRQPVGVVASVTPWNFPFAMISRKTAPAIASGCTVVLKPSELTPLTALAMAELGRRAGLPPGVFNILPTVNAKVVGDAMMESSVVRKIGFTGSTAVGKYLYAAAAKTVKRVSLELGGNAPFIVFEDADLERAARAVVASSYRNAGQTCICTNRVFVHERVHDALAQLVVERVKKLRVGAGLESGVTHGPLITGPAVDRVEEKVEEAVAGGAVVAVGGRRPSFQDAKSNGYFFQPTVLTNVDRGMRIFKEEIFGPVTPLVKFTSEEEVVAAANDTPYGLAGYFYTNDLRRAWRVSERLQYGMVGVNEVAITNEVAPFGGVKESGLGREQSKYGIDEYLDLKTVVFGGIA